MRRAGRMLECNACMYVIKWMRVERVGWVRIRREEGREVRCFLFS